MYIVSAVAEHLALVSHCRKGLVVAVATEGEDITTVTPSP